MIVARSHSIHVHGKSICVPLYYLDKTTCHGLPIQNDRLTEAFGSSKKKRALLSRRRNMIDSEEVGDTVAGAVQNLVTPAEEEKGKCEASGPRNMAYFFIQE